MLKKISFLGLITGALFMSSCDKLSTDIDTYTDSSVSEEIFQDIYSTIDETSQSDGNLRNSCATVTFDTTAGLFPNTVTIDFGTGCVGDDGRTREGQIIVTYTGRWRTVGTVVTATLQNYVVNGYQVAGTKTITNNGINISGNLSYTIAVTDGIITFPDNTTRTWNATRTREWTEGQNTSFATDGISGFLDDVYSITGNASGTDRNGNDYTLEITTPLIRKMTCRWLVEGVIVIERGDGETRSIDYGPGSCDATATVTRNNQTRDITLID